MKLNLKGIKIPTKEISVKIVDTEMEITIYPIGGFGLLKLQKLFKKLQDDPENIDTQVELIKFALTNGAKGEPDDVNFLIENDLTAAMQLTENILQFSMEYSEEKSKQAELAKKKSTK